MCLSESHSDSDFKLDGQEAVASGVDVAQLLAQLQAAKAQEAVGVDPEVLLVSAFRLPALADRCIIVQAAFASTWGTRSPFAIWEA